MNFKLCDNNNLDQTGQCMSISNISHPKINERILDRKPKINHLGFLFCHSNPNSHTSSTCTNCSILTTQRDWGFIMVTISPCRLTQFLKILGIMVTQMARN